ncbi:MAG TPA: GNAT family N-acetyltransferase [Candidatus Kapabacteria bacterium]|nr:GNAT family N-acetyltransferase [Candidatus Kapabacteria bacterium]
MMIQYAVEPDVSAESVAGLFRASGINRPAEDIGRIARMVANANLVITARDGGRLVGIARALTDFSYCCYLSDLAVDAEYQRRGIGRELIREVQKAIGPEAMLLLLAAPQAAGYYPHIGFAQVANGWIIHREH